MGRCCCQNFSAGAISNCCPQHNINPHPPAPGCACHLTLPQALEAAGFTSEWDDDAQVTLSVFCAGDRIAELLYTEIEAWLRGVLYERERQAIGINDFEADAIRRPHGATLTPTEILERIGEVG